jgi:hypothetical protein
VSIHPALLKLLHSTILQVAGMSDLLVDSPGLLFSFFHMRRAVASMSGHLKDGIKRQNKEISSTGQTLAGNTGLKAEYTI